MHTGNVYCVRNRTEYIPVEINYTACANMKLVSAHVQLHMRTDKFYVLTCTEIHCVSKNGPL